MILVYEQDGIKIVIPCTTELTIIEIGEKDIDKGIPFWVVDSQDLPSTPQETWKLENMGEPSGYGKRK